MPTLIGDSYKKRITKGLFKIDKAFLKEKVKIRLGILSIFFKNRIGCSPIFLLEIFEK